MALLVESVSMSGGFPPPKKPKKPKKKKRPFWKALGEFIRHLLM